MLKQIRTVYKYWFVRALFAILIGSFAIWGMSDFMRPNLKKESVATVGREAISRVQFYQIYRQELTRVRQEMKDDFEKTPQVTTLVARQVLVNLIHESLLRQEIKRLELSIPPEALRTVIKKQEAFQDENGNFSKERFAELLSNQRMSESSYLSMLRQDLKKALLLDAVRRGIEMPDVILTPLQEQLKETRSILFVRIPSSRFAIVGTPAEEALADFYSQNQPLFTQPERRDLSMILLDPKSFKNLVAESNPNLSGEELNQELVTHVYEKGKDVQDALASGSTLVEVAKSMSQQYAQISDVSNTGHNSEGKLIIGQKNSVFTLDMINAAFELSEGNESELLETSDGRYYIVAVDKTTPEAVLPLEEIKERVVNAYKDHERHKKAILVAQEIQKGISKGGSLRSLAQAQSLQVEEKSNVSIIDPPKGLSEHLIVQLFSAGQGGSAMVPTEDGAQVAQTLKINPNSVSNQKEKFSEIEKNMRDAYVQEILTQYLAALEKEFPVSINQVAIEEMLQAN